MVTGLAKAVAGSARGAIYEYCDVSALGDDRILGASVQWHLVQTGVSGVVECTLSSPVSPAGNPI